MPVVLRPRERAMLKGRAHALEPIVQVGHAGLSATVMAEIDRALSAHELVKIRLGGADRQQREEMGHTICTQTDAIPVQRVGKILVLWRPRPYEVPAND
jgi:RNA-binding protein